MNPPRTYRVMIAPTAWREISRQSEELQNKVFDKIYTLEQNPRPSGCKKLKGASGLYRVRIGDFRVVYDIQDGKLVVVIVEFGDRKEMY